jgi:acetoin utilization protein AcuB
MLVESIMSQGVWKVQLDDTIASVKELFESRGFHHVLVTDEERVVGVISDRDLLKNISPFVGRASERQQDAASLKKKVHQVMSRRLIAVTPDTPVQVAAETMVHHRISCLPVLDEAGECVGIVTHRDLLICLALELHRRAQEEALGRAA